MISVVMGFAAGYIAGGPDRTECIEYISRTVPGGEAGMVLKPDETGGWDILLAGYADTTTTTMRDGDCPPPVTNVSYHNTSDYSSRETVCIEPPQPECVCARWQCTTTTTTLPCKTVLDLDYVPTTRQYKMTLESGRFKPDTVKGFLDDTIMIFVYNNKGLYKLQDPSTNKSILLQPGEFHVFTLKADRVGEYHVTCSEHCEDPLGITIIVVEPYKEIC
ncbi:MAG TPA: hypothetical protein ENN13_03760 [Candidatus Altiarchaeales archaeon]|nr:hypothetical protein [Candidatus Altiarchaeales archaeon]